MPLWLMASCGHLATLTGSTLCRYQGGKIGWLLICVHFHFAPCNALIYGRCCRALARLRRQLLGVARRRLHDLGAGLTAGGINNSDRVAGLIVAHAPIIWLLLPIGAQRVALDLPLAVPHCPGRCLIERRAVGSPIDHALAGLPACRCCGGLQIGGLS